MFCLVLLGGFKFVPETPETFDLAVRAHSVDSPLITSGQITLDLPGLPHATIGQDGEANFKGLSAKLRAKPIKILAKIDGYEEKLITPAVDGNILIVKVERAHPVFVQKASLVPPPAKENSIQICIDGQRVETSFDELGGFRFTANGNAGDRVLVEVFADQKLAASDYYVLSSQKIDVHWSGAAKKSNQKDQ